MISSRAERVAGNVVACAVSALSLVTTIAVAQPPEPVVPLVAGMTFVLAVHTPPNAAVVAGAGNLAQGDYEMVVAISAVDEGTIVERMQIDGVDEKGAQLKLDIERRVLARDLAGARLQILGFHTDDPAAIDGTTSLGPSLAIVRDLRTTGSAEYSARNFRALTTYAGTFKRVGAAVPFPVLVNGRRVELRALRASGELRSEEGGRPWEEYILDHPQHPLTLRIAVGRLGQAAVDDAPVFSREIVRIDFPNGDNALEDALTKVCKAEVSGIYFDFDRATLRRESSGALQAIADVMRRQPEWRVAVGGHTDNVGADAYNLDLSARRAAAVKAALVGDYAVDARRLTTAGYGAKQPVETNDTIAGRARNRRVELVRDCG